MKLEEALTRAISALYATAGDNDKQDSKKDEQAIRILNELGSLIKKGS
jgi:hypothetical protein